MKQSAHTASSLRRDLRRLGLAAGDVVIVHLSMKSLGWVEGGPKAVTRAFQRALTPRGTLMMPTFSYNFERVYARSKAYDPKTSPSETGLLTEVFRRQPGVVRSAHPTHSVAAWGRLARELTEGHERVSGLDVDSPFGRAARRNATVLMVGCGFTSLSLLHVAEAAAPAPYLNIFNWPHEGWKGTALTRGADGKPVQVGDASVPGCSANFGRAQALAKKKGLLREGRLGDAKVLLFDAQRVLDLVAGRIRREPDYLLCPLTTCRACDERRTVFERAESPGADFVGEFLTDLIAKAPYRFAGSAGERKGAEEIARRMTAAGLSNVHLEEFPTLTWDGALSEVKVKVNGRWETVPSGVLAHSPSTGGKAVVGKAVHVESVADLDKVRDARNSIGVLWDGYGESVGQFRSLMRKGFKALILSDGRFNHRDVVAEGVPGQWLPDLLTPTVLIPRPEVVRLFGHGPRECSIRVEGRTGQGTSENVIGEIPGSGPGTIIVSAHHDSTYNSMAVDDNLSGVAALLRIASLLANEEQPRRAIRFCSFGAEEQLSEGARWHAVEYGGASGVQLAINNDGISARVGTSIVHVTGGPSLAAWLRTRLNRSPLQFKVIEEVTPFSDQFPFNVRGVPSVWFGRRTMASGRHFHHTVRDTLAEVSFSRIARTAELQAGLLRKLAWAEKLPFAERLPAAMQCKVDKVRRDWAEG